MDTLRSAAQGKRALCTRSSGNYRVSSMLPHVMLHGSTKFDRSTFASEQETSLPNSFSSAYFEIGPQDSKTKRAWGAQCGQNGRTLKKRRGRKGSEWGRSSNQRELCETIQSDLSGRANPRQWAEPRTKSRVSIAVDSFRESSRSVLDPHGD